MYYWLGTCMLLAAGFGFCVARLELKPGKKGKIMAAAVLLQVSCCLLRVGLPISSAPSKQPFRAPEHSQERDEQAPGGSSTHEI